MADSTEDDSGYLIKVEMPAIRKVDLKIHVEDGVLTIQGSRHFEKE
ncbi:MAG: Hsp20 family protein [Verrucomicrobia bacterium]|nr:Hsp20 family protein [Verrucomicrobiota bacterium]